MGFDRFQIDAARNQDANREYDAARRDQRGQRAEFDRISAVYPIGEQQIRSNVQFPNRRRHQSGGKKDGTRAAPKQAVRLMQVLLFYAQNVLNDVDPGDDAGCQRDADITERGQKSGAQSDIQSQRPRGDPHGGDGVAARVKHGGERFCQNVGGQSGGVGAQGDGGLCACRRVESAAFEQNGNDRQAGCGG